MIVTHPGIVVIAECDKLAACKPDPGIAGAPGTAARRVQLKPEAVIKVAPDQWVRLNDLWRRAVIDNDNFEVGQRLPLHATEHAGE